MSDVSVLFQPFQLGDLTLPNRIAMAPLTRNRATKDTNAANDLIARYYAQRASAGLLITEASQISQQGQGYIWTPGIYSQAQIDGWRKVTDAVHAAGGRIVIQIWHVGRISHVSLQPGGAAPVAPSAITANTKTFIETGFVPVSAPRALETAEIDQIVKDYAAASANALAAGFDGVEIHGANGYLLDQFHKASTNHRTDEYGGSIVNRARLTLRVAEAVAAAWPKGRVGIRLSPVTPANDVSDPDPQPLFNLLAEELGRIGLGFIHVIEGATGGPRDIAPFDYQALRDRFPGAYIANNGYDRDLAIDAVASGRADIVAFGRPFISNPDLVERLRIGAPLAELDRSTLYGGDEHGYTDYPALAHA